jgi:cytochrome P450
MSDGAAFTIGSPAFKLDPFPAYARMRELSPALRVPLRLPMLKQAVLLTRHDDVAALLKDNRFSKERSAAGAAPGGPPKFIQSMFAPLMNGMLDKDDPDHARLRRLVQVAFTPKRITEMTARIEALSGRLLDGLARQTRFDLIADYALPLPVAVISDMLGVPEADRAKFVRWSNVLIDQSQSPFGMIFMIPNVLAFMRYIRKMIALRRKDPTDDLTSALIAAQDRSDVFTDDEMLSMIVLLLTAGHETTTNLIGNGMLALLQHRDQFERLRAEPALIDSAIEELLRFASPVEMSTFRYAKEEVTIAGMPIAKGEAVLGVIASANRDERQFVEPGRLDIARDPNRHLTFGMGGHYCLGAPLARLEGRIAIPALLDRVPALKLDQDKAQMRWRPSLILRGLKSLPVRTA